MFTLVTFIFIACVFSTLYSFKEIPLEVLQKSSKAELQRVSDTSSSNLELEKVVFCDDELVERGGGVEGRGVGKGFGVGVGGSD